MIIPVAVITGLFMNSTGFVHGEQKQYSSILQSGGESNKTDCIHVYVITWPDKNTVCHSRKTLNIAMLKGGSTIKTF